MQPIPATNRQQHINTFLEQLDNSVPSVDVYLPTEPSLRITRWLAETASPMQSHAKAPYLLVFEVANSETGAADKRAVIFKMMDDCRQDRLALQLIAYMKRVFDDAGMGLFLYAYNLVTAGPSVRAFCDWDFQLTAPLSAASSSACPTPSRGT